MALLFSPLVHADSIALIQEWLHALEKNPEDAATLDKLGRAYLRQEEYEKAIDYGNRLIDLGESKNDRNFAVANGLFISGAAASMLERREEAFRNLENARMIAESSDNHDLLAAIHNQLGMYYINLLNDSYSAISHFYDGLQEAEKAGNHKFYSRILTNLSSTYLLRGDLEALKYILEAYKRAKECSDFTALRYAATNLAQYYILADSLKKAGVLIEEIGAIPESSDSQIVDYNYLKALYLFKKGEIDEAFALQRLTLEKYRDTTFKPGILSIYVSYGRLLNEAHRPHDAIKVFSEAVDFSRHNDVRLYKGELLKGLAESYRLAGDYPKALDYSNLYINYADSMYVFDKEMALEDARVRHKLAVREAKIAHQENELAKHRLSSYILIVILMSVLVAMAIGWYAYVRKRRLYRAIVRQNNEFLSREKELMDQLDKSHHNGDTSHAMDDSTVSASELMTSFTRLMRNQKLFKDPTLTESAVADLLATNRTYLSRTINECSGKSFNQIINGYRIQEAIAIISETEMPLKAVCAEAGFSSLSTFYSLFQNFTGLTPARYRAQIRALKEK